jgi:hypothetical protein
MRRKLALSWVCMRVRVGVPKVPSFNPRVSFAFLFSSGCPISLVTLALATHTLASCSRHAQTSSCRVTFSDAAGCGVSAPRPSSHGAQVEPILLGDSGMPLAASSRRSCTTRGHGACSSSRVTTGTGKLKLAWLWLADQTTAMLCTVTVHPSHLNTFA